MEPFSIGAVLAAGMRQTPRALLRLAPLLVAAGAAFLLAPRWSPLVIAVDVPIAAACAGAGVAAGLRRIATVLLVIAIALLVAAATGLALLLPALGERTGVAIEVMSVLWIVVVLALYSRWFVAVPVAVIERRGPVAALSRSHELTRDHRVPLAIALATLGALHAGTMLGLERVLDTDDRWFSGAGVLVWLVFAVVRANLSAAAFAQLRRNAEGATPDELEEVFQ